MSLEHTHVTLLEQTVTRNLVLVSAVYPRYWYVYRHLFFQSNFDTWPPNYINISISIIHFTEASLVLMCGLAHWTSPLPYHVSLRTHELFLWFAEETPILYFMRCACILQIMLIYFRNK